MAMTLNTLRKMYAVILSLSLLIAWVIGSYFQLDVSALLVFFGDDSHCDRITEAIGAHCFGDFASIRTEKLNSLPNGAEGVYPVSSRIFRYPFTMIERIFSYRVSVFVFLIVLAFAVLFPLLHQFQRKRMSISDVAILGICTLPFLATLDRGNLVGFTSAFLYLYIRALQRSRYRSAVVCLVLMVAIKPQLAVFLILMFLIRAYKVAIIGVVAVVSTVVLPYTIFGMDMLVQLKNWITAAQGWSKSQLPTARYPSNLSSTTIGDVFGVSKLLPIVVLCVTALYVGLTFLRSGKDTQSASNTVEDTSFVISVGMILASPITYPYYLVIMLPFLAFAIERYEKSAQSEIVRDGVEYVRAVALLVVMSPLVLPNSLAVSVSPPSQSLYNIFPLIQSGVLLVALLAFISLKQFRTTDQPGKGLRKGY